MVGLLIRKLHNLGEIQTSVWSLSLPSVMTWALWALLWCKANPAQSNLGSHSELCFLLSLFLSKCYFLQVRVLFSPLHKLPSHSLAKLPALGFPFLNHSSFPFDFQISHHSLPPSSLSHLSSLHPVSFPCQRSLSSQVSPFLVSSIIVT